MFVMFNGIEDDLRDEVLPALRTAAITKAIEAKGAMLAYREGMEQYWESRLEGLLGWKYNIEEREALLGANVVRIVGYHFGRDFTPEIEIREKTKSGKWGKSTYFYDAESTFPQLSVKAT